MSFFRKTLCLVVTFGLLACVKAPNTSPDGQAKKLEPLSILLDWTPNTNHTGLYVAQEKGYFAEEGYTVTITEPAEGSAPQLLATGKTSFAVSYQEAVTDARANNIPIVSIAAIVQHNTSVFASLESSGIQSVKDFAGKRYGGWGAPIEEAVLKAALKQANIPVDSVKIINLGMADFFSTIGREVDVEWVFAGWDVIAAEQKGIKLSTLYLKDLNPVFDYYTPVFITAETTLQHSPETVKHFLRAVSKGYNFAMNNPEEAAAILLKAVPELDAPLVQASQAYLSKEYQSDAPQWGWQNPDVWQRFSQWASEHGITVQPIDASKAFTNEYLPQS